MLPSARQEDPFYLGQPKSVALGAVKTPENGASCHLKALPHLCGRCSRVPLHFPSSTPSPAFLSMFLPVEGRKQSHVTQDGPMSPHTTVPPSGQEELRMKEEISKATGEDAAGGDALTSHIYSPRCQRGGTCYIHET